MSITIHSHSIVKLFSLGFIVIALSACAENITTQEQSQNYNTPIPSNAVIRVIADRSITTQDPLNKSNIHYSMNLYNPNNALLNCNSEQQSHNICISPPQILDAQQLFTANCTYSGTANVASFVMEYCVKSAFNTYPQGNNKRIVYTIPE